jgi:hypothetical protein
MFEKYTFELLRLRYLKGAMDAIAAFRPDGKTPTDVGLMIANATAPTGPRSAYESAKATLQLAQGEYAEDIADGHGACVQVYPIMKSRYRADRGSSSAVESLPTDDETPTATLTRLKAISTLWGKLPNPPGSATPFKAWDTMDKAAFDAFITAIEGTAGPPVVEGTLAGKATAESAFEVAEGALHAAEDAMADFATNALIQGRGQFPPGTANREVIDAIPTAPATQPPGQAVITNASSPAAGAVHFDYDAPHSTSWDVFRKGPGDADFVKVANDVIVKTYDATGLVAGAYECKVVGRNSKGDGLASAVSTITVG